MVSSSTCSVKGKLLCLCLDRRLKGKLLRALCDKRRELLCHEVRIGYRDPNEVDAPTQHFVVTLSLSADSGALALLPVAALSEAQLAVAPDRRCCPALSRHALPPLDEALV